MTIPKQIPPAARVIASTTLIMLAILIWNISASVTRMDIIRAYSQPQSSYYSDEITLPVEAFGAHWRIKNFRRNVLFPNGLEDAFPRAIQVSELLLTVLGRKAVITLGPRNYMIKNTIDFSGAHDLTIRGTSFR